MTRKQSSAFTPFGDPRAAHSAAPEVRPCAHPGCADAGEYRAPRDRTLKDYIWLCLDHVREYNKRWNYYEGMSESEVENEIRRDTCWGRPSWKLGSIGAGGVNWKDARMRDDFGFFREDAKEEARARGNWGRQTGSGQRRRTADTTEDKALTIMGLDVPLSKEALKSRYKDLVKRYHPDVNQGDKAAEEKLKDINEAYRTLLATLDV